MADRACERAAGVPPQNRTTVQAASSREVQRPPSRVMRRRIASRPANDARPSEAHNAADLDAYQFSPDQRVDHPDHRLLRFHSFFQTCTRNRGKLTFWSIMTMSVGSLAASDVKVC